MRNQESSPAASLTGPRGMQHQVTTGPGQRRRVVAPHIGIDHGDVDQVLRREDEAHHQEDAQHVAAGVQLPAPRQEGGASASLRGVSALPGTTN
jgi:hypothetical protein